MGLTKVRASFLRTSRMRDTKRIVKTAALMVGLLVLGVTVALAAGLLSLPANPVIVNHGPWLGGTLGSTIDIELINVPGGYDVSDGEYAGWCIEDNGQPDAPDGTELLLVDSTDTANLPYLDQSTWNRVNYLLNHKAGTVEDVQAAMWVLTWGSSTTFPVTPAR